MTPEPEPQGQPTVEQLLGAARIPTSGHQTDVPTALRRLDADTRDT